MNLKKHIWEGWTVQSFIDELEPMLTFTVDKPKTKEELKKWCMDNQPYYKKHIPEVVEYFSKKYKIK